MTIQKRQRPIYSQLFFAACEQLFHEPLFCHMDSSGKLCLLIWSDNSVALRECLIAAASCGCMLNTRLEIEVSGAAAHSVEQSMHRDNPMFDEIFSHSNTASIRFSETPTSFPPYVLCTPEKQPHIPENIFHAVIQPAEPSDELLRLAENLHYIFEISYGSRDALEDIVRKMHSINYNKASSILQAAHLPVKLWYAGVYDKDIEEAARLYTELIETDKGLVNRLVGLEHTRWSIFMALSGWRIPTFEEMKSYAFVEQPDGSMISSFRHEEGLLHPSLVACSPEGADVLEGEQGTKYWDGADDSQLDPLSRMSLWQHRYILDIAGKHRRKSMELLEEVKARSVNRIPELDRLSDIINSLPSSAAELEKALVLARRHIDGALFTRLNNLLKSSLEAAKRRSYLQGDIVSTKTIGFVLLFRSRFTRIIRLLSNSASDNISALMQLDPEKAAFITGVSNMDYSEEEERRGGVETFVQIRNLRTDIRFFDAAETSLEDAVGLALNWLGEDAIFDLTGASIDFLAISMAYRAFAIQNGRMVPSRFGAPFAIGALNALRRELYVSDVFAALNRRSYKGWETSDIGDIGNMIGGAFQAFLNLTEDENADSTSQYKKLFDKISKQFPFESYRKDESAPEKQHTITLSSKIAVKRNVTGCLRRMQDAGFISELHMDTDNDSGRYSYTFVSPEWIHCNKKGVRLLDFLKEPEQNDYICSVKYDKNAVLQMKVVYDEFEMPEDMVSTMEAFNDCFERCKNGRWKYISATAKGLFSAEGNILEDYVWHQVYKNPYYRDVQLSYRFGLASGNDKLEQEIDVIAITVQNRPVLFSCKLGAKGLKADSGKEIAAHSRVFAINKPIPVLVSSCPDLIAESKGFAPGGTEREYLEKRGVRFIDRTILSDEQKFQQFLSQIACT